MARFSIAESNKSKALETRERIRKYFMEHIGASRRECAEALNLNEMTVGRHIARMRAADK